jgi:hypothetical protein
VTESSKKYSGINKEQVPKSPVAGTRRYLPPFEMVLKLLGMTHLDISSASVTISVASLRFLLSELLTHIHVDEPWYLEKYLDVRAAALSGDVGAAAIHFQTSGYMEGRFPHEIPFDPAFYFATYPDLATTYDATDTTGLRLHFETGGYFEGRAGVAEQLEDAERWRAAIKGL